MLENQISVIKTSIDYISAYMTQANKGKKIAELSKQLNDLKASATTILVCGEFKRGKSTFINALIGRNICPTDVDICTSVVSIIKYGVKEKATRVYGDFSNLKSEVVPFDSIEEYTVGTAEEIGNTICMELELPLDELKKGLIIIDTPGVGGLDPRHAMLTNYFLPQADITLFMTDVNEPLTTTELKFYKDKVLQYAKRSAIIVNKADLKDNDSVEEIRKDTINKVSTYTQVSADSLNVISASAADCIREEEGLGNFDKVRDLIGKLVCDYKAGLLRGIRDDLSEQLDLIITPLQLQISQIESPDVDQIKELTQKKSEIETKIADLSNPASTFRVSVSKKIASEHEQIINWLNEASIDLSSSGLTTLLKNEKSKTDNGGEWLGQQINDAMESMGSEIALKLNKAFENVAKMPEFEGLLNYTAKQFTGKVVTKNIENSTPVYKRILSSTPGWGVAMISGVVLQAIPIVNIIAPIALGIYTGYKNQKDVVNTQQESQLRQLYQPQIAAATQNMRNYVESRFSEFQSEWISVISGRAQDYKECIQSSIMQIQQLKQQINLAVNKKVSLQNQLNPLTKAKKNIDDLVI